MILHELVLFFCWKQCAIYWSNYWWFDLCIDLGLEQREPSRLTFTTSWLRRSMACPPLLSAHRTQRELPPSQLTASVMIWAMTWAIYWSNFWWFDLCIDLVTKRSACGKFRIEVGIHGCLAIPSLPSPETSRIVLEIRSTSSCPWNDKWLRPNQQSTSATVDRQTFQEVRYLILPLNQIRMPSHNPCVVGSYSYNPHKILLRSINGSAPIKWTPLLELFNFTCGNQERMPSHNTR